MAVDPVEKKPLYHFLPGYGVFSIGSLGCNMSCSFCQNSHISQADHVDFSKLKHYESYEILDRCRASACELIAFTYNEPIISFEFMEDTARLAHSKGILNAMISNGFINSSPLEELIEFIDAFNIDLKAFNEEFYRDIAGAKLRPVLNTLEQISKSGRHLEITFLLIPGMNDSEEEFRDMISWISDHCGPQQVLHISRYFPRHRLMKSATPLPLMERFSEIAREKLSFVYPGNTGSSLDAGTYCPRCGKLLIERSMYKVLIKGIDAGKCISCNYKIPGVFKN